MTKIIQFPKKSSNGLESKLENPDPPKDPSDSEEKPEIISLEKFLKSKYIRPTTYKDSKILKPNPKSYLKYIPRNGTGHEFNEETGTHLFYANNFLPPNVMGMYEILNYQSFIANDKYYSPQTIDFVRAHELAHASGIRSEYLADHIAEQKSGVRLAA
jgi:hypothetical protein